MIMIMRALAMKLATGVQAGVTINLLWMHCPYYVYCCVSRQETILAEADSRSACQW
jgi:hypothetical protein